MDEPIEERVASLHGRLASLLQPIHGNKHPDLWVLRRTMRDAQRLYSHQQYDDALAALEGIESRVREIVETLRSPPPPYTPPEIVGFCSRGIAIYEHFIRQGKKPTAAAKQHYRKLVVWRREAEERGLSDARIRDIQGEVLKSWEQIDLKCKGYGSYRNR
ncbi:MAG TPA: hypothetical protein VJC16_04615 [Candidatus Nanoarchaeia archaeon]|nr:hypothetical protein [Candidatus Nanoarchaeia archaeon]